jgi:hypothetical protein
MTSLATMLFDGPAAGRAQLDALLGPTGLDLGRLTVAGCAIEPPQVSGTLIDLLDMPIGNLAIQGWSTIIEVEHARQRTLAAPGSREVVTLGRHSITSTQCPTVEASLGGTTIPVLRLTVEVRPGLWCPSPHRGGPAGRHHPRSSAGERHRVSGWRNAVPPQYPAG